MFFKWEGRGGRFEETSLGVLGGVSGAQIIDDLPEIIFRIYFGCLSVLELWESLLLGRYF